MSPVGRRAESPSKTYFLSKDSLFLKDADKLSGIKDKLQQTTTCSITAQA